MQTFVVDPEVMGELVDDRDPDLVGEVVRVGEVRLEGQTEERDPVRDRRPVRAPVGARDTLVQAVQGVVGIELVLAPLVGRRFVGDDDRDLIERLGERVRDGRQGQVDEVLEGAVMAGPRLAGPRIRGGA